MENLPKPLALQDYAAIALRRKWYILIPLVCSVIISMAVYKFLPKIYQATTLILVQPQQVPQSYVQPTITASVTDRLNTITQEILSRTRLEKVIEEFNLYADLKRKEPMEVVVEKMRKDISVSVQSRGSREQNTFSVSFVGENPRNVMVVTNKLASLFIEENLKVRELQAESTSNFLSKELEAVETQLIKKEEERRKFSQRYMGELPQQLDANLRILERLQQQLKTTSDGIRAAEDRSIFLQSQIEQLKKQEPPPILPEPRSDSVQSVEEIPQDRIPEDSTIITQWNLLKRELEIAQSKYTENHPDVINLKRKIASIEPNAKEMIKKQEAMAEAQRREFKTRRKGASSEKLPIRKTDPALERILVQYTEQYNAALLGARRLRDEENKLKEQINLYQTRIEETPKREQELLLITRDYNLLNANYQSLMNKKIQSQMAENLERKQQGEQFRILDPARFPVKPFKPERNKILLVGTFIGLVAGLGLAWFRETLDQSFHSESDLEGYLDLPILAVVPNLKEEI